MIIAKDGDKLPASFREVVAMGKFSVSAVFFGVLLSSQVVFADDSACNSLAALAKSIMSSRQAGVPMTRAIELISTDNKQVADVSRKLVIAAYEEPAWGSKAMQEKATTEFQNKIYLPCIKGS